MHMLCICKSGYRKVLCTVKLHQLPDASGVRLLDPEKKSEAVVSVMTTVNTNDMYMSYIRKHVRVHCANAAP